MTLRAVAVSFGLSLACAVPCFSPPALATTEDFFVAGNATYRERVALKPGAKFEATLEDASRGGKVIARDRQNNPGSGPISFRIGYDPRRVDPGHDYVVRATVSERGHARLTGVSSYRMPRHGHGKHVSIVMRAVSAGGHEGGPSKEARDRERRVKERRSSGRTAGITTGLTSKRWGLVNLDGHAVTVPARGKEPWIELDGHSMKITGSGGCNQISGGYEGTGPALRFGRLIATQTACASMDTERAFLRALERTRQYRIQGKLLDLMDDRGEILAQLEERNR